MSFYAGALLLALFEFANVYFIMPLPYSQRLSTVRIAFWLHQWRWAFRAVSIAFVLLGFPVSGRGSLGRKFAVATVTIAASLYVYATNAVMRADRMFLTPSTLTMSAAESNSVERTRLVVGVNLGGESRAYPIQFIGYHHQVRDTIAGVPILVTFCTVCRTGRVYSPMIDGILESFRLVGMDHLNAMLEDGTTGSWWMQATGEAIVGSRQGKQLQVIPSRQMTLAQWMSLYPSTLIMQGDTLFGERYAKEFGYESGASRSALTGTDTMSWQEKSWVVGITANGASKAFDWNRLRVERAINDEVGGTPIVLALSMDGASFAAFVRPDRSARFMVRNDSLVNGATAFDFGGRGSSATLTPIAASQEFWHSWRTFQPGTARY